MRFGAQAVAEEFIHESELDMWLHGAKQGEPEAYYNLGLLYSNGQGVSLDYIAAHKWFNLAAMRGSEDARACRAQLAQDMSQADIAEAQRQAREWLVSLQ